MTFNTASVQSAGTSSRSSYLDILEAAWQDHLAPREPNAPTVISTFAGAGGSSLGYSMAGYRELLAVEWDDNAVATFKLNFPDVPVYHGDIAKLSVEDALRLTGLRPGELDVFDGSPPCQGFSTAGKRQIDDPRNELFREYVRLLRGLQPKVFVMENVSGMVKGKMKLVFAEILRELKASGYKVSARLMNAMYFNVPQSRERLIFVGVREDVGREPSHPKAESAAVTVRDAFTGIAPITIEPLTPQRQREVASVPQGRSLGDVTGGRGYSTVRLALNSPSPTIPKRGSARAFGPLIHPTEHRGLSIEEAKRLASFSDEYAMAGRYDDQWERIGNSVPPLFMRAIALHIRRHILT